MDLSPDLLAWLAAGVFVVAVLYSCVGHAGASGYIAVMSLAGIATTIIKPTSLVLNILVASIGSYQFYRAGHFSWRLFWPFAILAVPMAFVGGYVTIPARAFKIALGIILIYSAALFMLKRQAEERQTIEPNTAIAVILGGAIGLLSGLTGTGGGIFLTPILLFKRWATAKSAAGVSALFILVNSVAGLLGNLSSTHHFPAMALVLLVAAGVGGTIGSYWGSKRFRPVAITRALALVLVLAGAKLLLTK